MRVGLPVIAEALDGVLATTTPADAARNWDLKAYSTDGGQAGARIQFAEDGDVLQLCDLDADGYKAYAKAVRLSDDSVRYTITDTTTNNGCAWISASTGGNLAENYDHKIWVCRQKSGRPPQDCGWIRFDNNR